MTKANFEHPSPRQISDAIERSRQMRSDEMAQMMRGLWARLTNGAQGAPAQPRKMADC